MTDDIVQPFSVVAGPIHGRLAVLGDAWRAILGRHPYPGPVADLLGEMVAAVALLAQGLKSARSLTLQVSGDGVVRSAMVECRERRSLRGLARMSDGAPEPAGRGLGLVGDGHLAITVHGQRGATYQGLIAMSDPELARCIEAYFASSEQLPTRLWLAASQERAIGLLVQRLPAPPGARAHELDAIDGDWERVLHTIEGFSRAELLAGSTLGVLHRLDARAPLRITTAAPLEFSCSCSRERSSNALRLMGREEVRNIVAEEHEVRVTCEFCGTTYRYDSIDAEMLFAPVG